MITTLILCLGETAASGETIPKVGPESQQQVSQRGSQQPLHR